VAKLPESFLSELKFRNPIEEVIGGYAPVKRMGRYLKCRCPFHDETDASFTIYLNTQSYFCFGCRAAGDVINFVKEIENIDYMSAVKLLAERAKLEMPERDEKYEKAERERKKILEINKISARFFHDSLFAPGGVKALEYLLNRGLSLRTIKRFGLGWSPPEWDSLSKLLIGKGCKEDELVTAAVSVRNRKGSGVFDIFRSRVMFPIINIRNEVIGFGGRLLEGEGPKYLNSPDSPAFKKSRNLFAINFAKSAKEKNFILAEGYMDVIALHQAGFSNSVASLGTALTKEQINLISVYAKEVILSYDSDNAGQAASKRAIALFDKSPVRARVLTMRGAKDPDEFIRKFSAEKYALAIERSAAATDFLLDRIRGGYNLDKPDEKVLYLREAEKVLAQLSDPAEQDIYSGILAEEVSVDKALILSQVRGEKTENAAYPPARTKTSSPKENRAPSKIEKAEETVIAFIYKNNTDLDAHISEAYFINEINRRVFQVLSERVSRGESCDLAALEDILSREEKRRLVKIINDELYFSTSKKTFADCAAALKKEKSKKTDSELSGMSPEDLGAYISRLGKKKV
jgi:DNA primase